jgi:hypothetical protein
MPPAVATAALIAAAGRALHEAGHAVVAEALMLFLAGADMEGALGLRPGWRAFLPQAGGSTEGAGGPPGSPAGHAIRCTGSPAGLGGAAPLRSGGLAE